MSGTVAFNRLLREAGCSTQEAHVMLLLLEDSSIREITQELEVGKATVARLRDSAIKKLSAHAEAGNIEVETLRYYLKR